MSEKFAKISVIENKNILVPFSLKRIYKNFEQTSVSYVIQTLKEGDIFVDVGSNFGFYSVLASHLVGPSGNVISIEPSPLTLDILRLNVLEYQNIRIAPYAISRNSGAIDFYHTDDFVNSGSVANPPFISEDRVSKISVSARRLDDVLIKDFHIKKINFLKIDVQGDDMNVLGSSIKVLDISDRVSVLVEWAPAWMLNAGFDPLDLPKKLAELGFTNIFCIDDWLKKPMSIEDFWSSYKLEKSGKRFCNLFASK